jgi:hypothetical protein
MKAEGVIQIAFMRAAMRELVRQAKVRLPQLTTEEGRKELEQDIELLESVAATVPLYDSEKNDIVLVKFFGDERIPIKLEAA